MIAFDARSEGITGAPATSLTYSHTCTGSDLFLYTLVRVHGGGTTTGVTYNGVALTKIDEEASGEGNSHWYLINPATGAHNVVVSVSASINIQSASTSYTGTKPSGQPDNTSAIASLGDTSTPSVSITSIADECWHIMGLTLANGRTVTAGANTTLRSNGQYSGGTVFLVAILDSNSAKTPPGSKTLNATLSTSDTCDVGGITLAPLAGSASQSPSGSASASVSPSASGSASGSKSVSPSSSESASESSSRSASESRSLSPSGSQSPSGSESASSSASQSPSGSESASASTSLSPSGSESASASKSLSPSASGSASGSASQSPSASESASGSASQSPSGSLSPSSSGSASGSASESKSGSASESKSGSASASASGSASQSPSGSGSASGSGSESKSASSSASGSFSPSGSPSSSLSASASASSSPSSGWKNYTKGDYATLPTNDDDLETDYTDQEILDVATQNGVFVGQTATSQYMVHQFKEYVGDDEGCEVELYVKSSFAPATSPVYLQVFNQNSGLWETLDSNTTAAANAGFTLTEVINHLTNYRTAQKTASFRIYQLSFP